MIFYGVVNDACRGDPVIGDVVELFLRREDAEQFVAECLEDEPQWAGVLRVEPVEFETEPN